jgi:O-antigen ligase
MLNFQSFCVDLTRTTKTESKNHISFLPFLLLITTIPLHNGLNNLFLGVFTLTVLLKINKNNFRFNTNLSLLVLLFIIATLSLLWSIDLNRSLRALPRFIPFILCPILFMTMRPFSKQQILKIIQIFSFSIVLYVLFFLVRAFIRFIINGDVDTFFYHQLIPKDLNAIHFSVYVSVAFFYFLTQEIKLLYGKIICGLLFLFMILLSAYAILLTLILLLIYYYFFFSKIGHQLRLRNLIVFILLIFTIIFVGKIEQSVERELKANTEKSINHTVIDKDEIGLKIISSNEAWSNEKFSPNDFFPGTAFRVYQARMFVELFQEENVFWKGFGLNASYKKLEEKAIKYDVFRGNESQEGYQTKNFHNQYIQNFAELGVFGFLILIVLLGLNLKNATKNKDFVQIAFAVLMISLFLTESFLWRQRGVMFFTLLYCLFNTKEYLPLKKM